MPTGRANRLDAMNHAKVHRTLALTILGGAVLQYFIAGLFNFGTDSLDAHRIVGSLLTLLGLIALVLAYMGRQDALQPTAVLFGLLLLQHVLAVVGNDVSVIGALHPVNGLLILLAAMLASAGRRFEMPPGGHRRTAA